LAKARPDPDLRYFSNALAALDDFRNRLIQEAA
jgi:hypothetical protein